MIKKLFSTVVTADVRGKQLLKLVKQLNYLVDLEKCMKNILWCFTRCPEETRQALIVAKIKAIKEQETLYKEKLEKNRWAVAEQKKNISLLAKMLKKKSQIRVVSPLWKADKVELMKRVFKIVSEWTIDKKYFRFHHPELDIKGIAKSIFKKKMELWHRYEISMADNSNKATQMRSHETIFVHFMGEVAPFLYEKNDESNCFAEKYRSTFKLFARPAEDHEQQSKSKVHPERFYALLEAQLIPQAYYLPYLDDKEIILVLGAKGVGKSTIVNRLLGHTFAQEIGLIEIRKDNNISFSPSNSQGAIKKGLLMVKKKSNTPVASMKNGMAFSTKTPQVYVLPENIVLIDCPGFGDSDELAQEIINLLMIRLFVEKAAKVIGIMAILSYDALEDSGRGASCLQFVRQLNYLVDYWTCMSNILWCFTRCPEKINNQHLIEKIEALKQKEASAKNLKGKNGCASQAFKDMGLLNKILEKKNRIRVISPLWEDDNVQLIKRILNLMSREEIAKKYFDLYHPKIDIKDITKCFFNAKIELLYNYKKQQGVLKASNQHIKKGDNLQKKDIFIYFMGEVSRFLYGGDDVLAHFAEKYKHTFKLFAKHGKDEEKEPVINSASGRFHGLLQTELGAQVASLSSIGDKEIILVLGAKGVGKSTVVNWLLGHKFACEIGGEETKKTNFSSFSSVDISRLCNSKEDTVPPKKRFMIVKEKPNTPVAAMGDGMNSCTKIPQVFILPENIVLLDCPGFDTSDGEEQEILNLLMIRLFMEKAKKVTAIMALFPYSVFTNGEKSSHLLRLVKQLNYLLRIEQCAQNILWCFTKCPKGINRNDIVAKIKALKQQQASFSVNLTQKDQALLDKILEKETRIRCISPLWADSNVQIMKNLLNLMGKGSIDKKHFHFHYLEIDIKEIVKRF